MGVFLPLEIKVINRTNIGNLSLNRLKKGQMIENLKLFSVLEFVYLVI